MFNDIENKMWSDEELDDEFDYDFDDMEEIGYEYEEKAIEYFSNKQKEKLKKLIDELSLNYDESKFLHILALYKILNNENTKDILEKSLKWYVENTLSFHKKIVIFLTYELTKYYEDRKTLEKLYTYILKKSYQLTNGFSPEILNDIVDFVLEAREWLIHNLELNEKDKTIINFIALSVLDETMLIDITDEEIDKIYRNYVKLLWELRKFINIEKTFAPLLRGVGWNYALATSKNDEEMISYFFNLGVDKHIATELLKLYWKNDESDDNGEFDFDDYPF